MKALNYKRPYLLAIALLSLAIASVAGTALAYGKAKPTNQYYVKTQIFVDGQLVSTPQFVVIEGEGAEMETKSEQPQRQLKMKLKASEASDSQRPQGVRLKISLEYKDAGNLFRADPQVIVEPKKETLIPLAGNFEMRVVAERK